MADRPKDPVPPSAYPSLQPVSGPQPGMPKAWVCTALLHPFSPPFSTDPTPNNPFFQLCVATVTYMQGKFLVAQIAGCSYGTWWYEVTRKGTRLSTDKGVTWTNVDMGWTLPSNWFGNQFPNAACAGSSPLNWMAAQNVDWWKVPVPLPNSPPAATWMWFDSASQVPVRMMFGYGPPSPTKGDPTQLALFQMYSFTYFPVFKVLESTSQPTVWTNPTFPGFAVGNPNRYKNFVWNSNFGMTAFMTPVNENFNPLPTRVLYVWKPDAEYYFPPDRAQHTLMQYYPYNATSDTLEEIALLFGKAPRPTPSSDIAFDFKVNRDAATPCIGGKDFPFPQEPPDWVSIPAVEGTLQATITDNPVLCPGQTVTVYSVLFPPAKPNYLESTYLWTWYAPMPDSDGTRSRPVTFMQSQSGVGVGTSLALADYFYYEEFATPIDPANFAVPPACVFIFGSNLAAAENQPPKGPLRFRLP